MKKTDDRLQWEPAPINGKDVVWSFIVDGLKEEHEVIENPQFNHVAMYGSDGCMAIALCAGSSIMIEAESELAAKEMAHAIADPINEEEGNDDLYVDVGEPYSDDDADDVPFRSFGAVCIVQFYHTDTDNN